MEIEILKKDMAPTVEVKSIKERKQIHRGLKEMEVKHKQDVKQREEETQGAGERYE